ncbi:MAG: NADPH:quinone reductase [Gaiellales bacterium]|nr:NADPH:quinone reductase [Gaiellales bacterium]
MRAVMVTGYGGTDVLDLVEIEGPAPAAGQLLVDVTVAGVNFRDCYERQGAGYGGTPPFVTGAEGAGIVTEVGEGVSDVHVGDRVAWSQAPGSYAEQVLVDAASAIPLPTGVSDEIAAAVLLQGMTAHYLSHDVYPVQDGDTVLVHAGAGGVGLLLTQMVRSRGGRVISTVSTEEKADLARAAGASETIPYEGFRERVRELTGGEGVAAVYDGVGKDTFDESLLSLRVRGTMALYGASSGAVDPVDPRRLMTGGSLILTRPSLPHFTRTRSELLARSGEVLTAVADGSLAVRIGGVYPLADARTAQDDLQARRTTGKLLLEVRSME